MTRSPDAVLARLTGLYPKAIDLSLGRVRHLLDRLGNPQDRLPPVVHVAGTNGKGSTIATLRAIVEAAGYRAHAYTSPHLVRFNERIRLAGQLIEDDALVGLLDEIERTNDGTPITFFEITTAAAFLAFARTPADIVLLETGLGGRRDATNVVARPAVTAITPISMDHMNFLGDTLAAIAEDKAGIIKAGVPVVITPQRAEAMAVLEAEVREVGAPAYRAGAEWQAIPTASGWRFEGRRWSFDLPPSRLPGRHQTLNAGGAVACLEQLQGFDIDRDAIARGLGAVEWPARLQRLTRGPLVDLLPPDWELWLDGAHNEGGGAVLGDHLAGWTARPTHLIVGALNTRNPADFLRPVAPHVASVRGVAIPGAENSHTADAIVAGAEAVGIDAMAAPSVEAALASIRAAAGPGPVRVMICGTLYLAGWVLAENG
ncbi:MAG TPA: folylpolyglutamate synthase/dihydrofolate synthase family protein [Aliidongia sp.]|uniref:bifunctional folylpolyglutamate synthase/dihydrofolate synthase n=1 Tax=Aliidongia sp. TaxID=1914230 RepID=UPI002DDDA9E2|nr:folylpolyglutamate synthase/dihydrofolate synthase family protein [Aliidongia sp.]HEV2677255.1 folylpolyglutamate synthase/dihydrofolate synthase family protein [Aliidongia sp.]